jgi:hypothetical protein
VDGWPDSRSLFRGSSPKKLVFEFEGGVVNSLQVLTRNLAEGFLVKKWKKSGVEWKESGVEWKVGFCVVGALLWGYGAYEEAPASF